MGTVFRPFAFESSIYSRNQKRGGGFGQQNPAFGKTVT